MTTPIIEVTDLVKEYGGTPAVRGVSFAIEEGEIFGLLGPNGAGKTTTLSMLSTLLAPTSGTVTIAGWDIRRDAARVKALCGFVPQDLALYPSLSARDNLILFGRLYGLRGGELRSRLQRVLEMVGVEDRADEPVETLSGGLKRRINLAAGLLHRPRILFLDEPTVGVDPQSRNHLFETVERLSREGTTIVYTTHYMEEAERLCRRIAIIDHGRILALDTPRALVASIGGSIIRMGLQGVRDGILERLRSLPEVASAELSDQRLSLRTAVAGAALVPAIEVLNACGTTIHSLEILEPNLEAVFLHLTGKELRD
jgi:ABC-2 type transport system ATP-binding protein